MRKPKVKDIIAQKVQDYAYPIGPPYSRYLKFSFSCSVFPKHIVQIKEMKEKE